MTIGLEQIPQPEFDHEGSRFLYFGGTSYLGMQYLPIFKSKMAESVLEVGTHWGASRSGNVVLDIYRQTEQKLAQWAGSEDALTVSSGFMAGRLLVDYFSTSEFISFFSPSCHAALLPPGAKRSRSWVELGDSLMAFINSSTEKQAVLFTDSLDFQDYPGDAIHYLKEIGTRSCILVADDSHGLGILGPNGRGSYKDLNALGYYQTLVCGSLGKALGLSAGVIFGASNHILALMQTSMFAGASPAGPANLKTLLWAMKSGIYDVQKKKLEENITYFHNRIGRYSLFSQVSGHSVWTFKNPKLASYLSQNQIIITHFDYSATGEGHSPSRIVLSAEHTQPQIDRLANRIESFLS